MTPVFLDTVGLLALWDRSDQWHADAEASFTALASSRVRLVTTRSVLLECGNAAARRPYRLAVEALRQELERTGDLIAPTEDDWITAWRAYRRGDADNAGIVDQLSFAVMRRLGWRQALTNDHHFRAAGFEVLF